MSKKKKVAKLDPNSFAGRIAANMGFRELQRACIVRGMPFEEMVDSDFHQLQSWFIRFGDNTQSLALLDEFDTWVKEVLISRGYPEGDPVHHPSLRLGYIAEQNADGEVTKKKRIKSLAIEKPKKKKAERVEGTNILAGTKKASTYKCALAGYSLEKTIEEVTKGFEDANPSSIRNWYKRCLKENKKE